MKTKLYHHNHAFTLLEMLLVVAIIAVLAGIAIVAINPGKQLATVRNTERSFNLGEIHKAMQQYFIDHYTYPAATPTTLTEICNTGSNSTSTGIDCTGLIDLSPLVPTYLTSIPIDPQGSTLSFINNFIPKVYATTNGTGYKVMKDSDNKIVLTAPQAELSAFIAIGTTTPTTASCTATGGTITEVGGYCIHTFLLADSGTDFVVPSGSLDVDVLVVGGGGSGGSGHGGGGGAGGIVYEPSLSISGNYTVVVGDGGASAPESYILGSSGGDSSFGAYTASGGGGGGAANNSHSEGFDGGCGGGGGYQSGAGGTGSQGYNGGSAGGDQGGVTGGGGGMGGAGQSGDDNPSGGNGGIGIDYSSIFGTGVGDSGWFGGGGGGNKWTIAVGGTGGQGGGGNGAGGGGTTTSGLSNTGGGGGGAHGEASGAGGSGIVIVRYLK
jgi:prepilin-type N-terminal cleavage/methylation domain-containing protein